MRRIILDTRSNHFFRGIALDQYYDQRGGLCQVGEGHVVVTAAAVDPDYIAYWRDLGFSIPRMISLGSGGLDPNRTLSERILDDPAALQILRDLAGPDTRLEFGYIEASEARLARMLGIPAYCSFDLCMKLSRKTAFKEVCRILGLNTPDFCPTGGRDDLLAHGKELLASCPSILVKADNGSGGICSGGMFRADTPESLSEVLQRAFATGQRFFLEKTVSAPMGEMAVHWEMREDGQMVLIGMFDQISKDYGYAGAAFPSGLPDRVLDRVRSELSDRLWPYLAGKGAKGYFCADILVDERETPLWIDFNPRKGAILYVWEMVRRIAARHYESAGCCFRHEHVDVPETGPRSFAEAADRLDGLLNPQKPPFVVITNPGVIPFGCVDLTGISRNSGREAVEIFNQARERLLNAG